jgi:hypothetical protein
MNPGSGGGKADRSVNLWFRGFGPMTLRISWYLLGDNCFLPVHSLTLRVALIDSRLVFAVSPIELKASELN